VWTLTILCWLAYCVESLAASVVGPVLPDLAKRSGVEVAALTIMVPAFNAGGAVGNLAGGVAFDAAAPGSSGGVGRTSFLLLASLQVGIAITNGLTPASTDPMLMAGATFVHGIFDGAFRCGANWSMLRLHAPDTVAPYLQTMHFCSGAGRFIAGLVGAQFAGTEQLLMVFRISSGLALAVGTALGLIALSLGSATVGVLSSAPSGSGKKAGSSSASKAAGQDTTQFIGLLALFVFLLMGAQNSFQYLATSYAVSASPPLEFGDSSKAAMLSASYGGAFAVGRLLSIPASVRMTALAMMACSVAVAVAALAAVVAAPASSETLQMASASLGLALASLFPSALNYAKSTLGDRMTGGMLSIIMLSGTFGGVVVPKIAGQLLGGEVAGFSGPDAMMQLLLLCTASGAAMLVAAASSAPKSKTE